MMYKTAKDFKWYVALTNSGDNIALVMVCPVCLTTMTFSDYGSGIMTQNSIQSHQCNQRVVSEPSV